MNKTVGFANWSRFPRRNRTVGFANWSPSSRVDTQSSLSIDVHLSRQLNCMKKYVDQSNIFTYFYSYSLLFIVCNDKRKDLQYPKGKSFHSVAKASSLLFFLFNFSSRRPSACRLDCRLCGTLSSLISRSSRRLFRRSSFQHIRERLPDALWDRCLVQVQTHSTSYR